MCIAILNLENIIDEETFNTCWKNNPDGGGLAYVEFGKVKIIKEMDSVGRMHKFYTELRKRNVLPMIIHFRIATSGNIDEDNCHPFEVNANMVMAHNGIIDNVEPSPTISDTRIFIKEILQELPGDFLWNGGILQLISGFVGDSKLVFLDREGMFHIINEELGHWDKHDRNWFSNYSYLALSEVDRLFLGRKYRNTHFAFGKNNHSDLQWNEDQWGMCESCENWVEYNDLEYDNYLNVTICNDCKGFYYEDNSR